jgi:hypothetical protein
VSKGTFFDHNQLNTPSGPESARTGGPLLEPVTTRGFYFSAGR